MYKSSNQILQMHKSAELSIEKTKNLKKKKKPLWRQKWSQRSNIREKQKSKTLKVHKIEPLSLINKKKAVMQVQSRILTWLQELYKVDPKTSPIILLSWISTIIMPNNTVNNKKIPLYSGARRATSISWSDLPLVSTTFFFTKATAIKQNVAKIVYKIWGPICSSKRRKSRPTKKFITCSKCLTL